MKNTHPVEVLLLGAWLALEAAAVLLTALVALLLTLARWRPTSTAAASGTDGTAPALPAPVTAGTATAPTAPPAAATIEGLTVAQLRRLARSAGLPRALSRNGRRGQLLEALAVLEVAPAA